MSSFKIINIVLSFLVTFTGLHAVEFEKYAGEFLSLGAGSRATGMAGAYVAVANDVTAGYWNPAALIDAKPAEVIFMHSKQFISSVQYNLIAASSEMKDGSAIGISFLYLTMNGISDTRDAYDEIAQKLDYSRIKEFNAGDYVFLITYAKPYSDKLSYGMNVKLISRAYEVESALGLGFDIGFKYRIYDNLILGAMFKDVTSSIMTWSTGKKDLITPSIRTGISYLLGWDRFNLTFQPAVDLNIMFEGREYAAQYNIGPISFDTFVGMEVAYKNTLAIRAGYDDLNRFNTGIGVKIPKIAFDYSFTAGHSDLGDVQRITFHLTFDHTIF
ncbi:MAG: PorV/PorQ family protein [Calditrichaceae bacterium]